MKRIFWTFLIIIIALGCYKVILTKEDVKIEKKRVLVGAPVYQKPMILEQFLTSLTRLDKKSYELDYYFVDDNDQQESSQLLENFSQVEGQKCIIIKPEQAAASSSYVCDEATHHWKEELIWKVAGFKDKMIEYALTNNYDYLFLIDSDLVLHPHTIEQLIQSDKDVISNVFWTAWTVGAIEQPQVWLTDFYTQHKVYAGENLTPEEVKQRQAEFFEELRKPGIYDVGGLGACTLISRHALQKGVNFKKIDNITFWGEDRHFCIRAMALGLKLHVDTHYPAYHIYRESYLSGVEGFVKKCEAQIKSEQPPRITLSLIMKNEANNHLTQCLANARKYITDAVIIDDGSEDNSVQVALEALKGIPVHLIKNESSKFANEVSLRKQQWEETIKQNPDWILVLDADEIFEDHFAEEVKELVKNPNVDAYYFRLYDFWDENHYRDDFYWKAHQYYRPFLVRYHPNIIYNWKETPQHCGRFPLEIYGYQYKNSPLRLKHYGWARAAQRIAKYERYQKLDPGAKYGWKEQYESILDPNPHTVLWVENLDVENLASVEEALERM